MNSQKHYHILWSKVDWKPFPTSEEAGRMAEQIKKPGGNYFIEERDDGCEICEALKAKATTFFDRASDHAI